MGKHLFRFMVKVFKSSKTIYKRELDQAGWTVPLFTDDDFRNSAILFGGLVFLFAKDKKDHISVLLN
jgi:hypothetical protein